MTEPTRKQLLEAIKAYMVGLEGLSVEDVSIPVFDCTLDKQDPTRITVSVRAVRISQPI